MANGKPKLELTWIGKDNQPRLEPRILIEDPTKSYGDKASGNMLIHGDNLLALKALEQDYAGKVKCIFIDPPYNTGSAFKQYDDGLEHSIWLSLMRDRLVILKNLLSSEGSLWITIDDNEAHYLKVLCDEVFGRNHFVANVVWQKKYAVANDHKTIAPMHDHVLVYRKTDLWKRNLIPRTEEKDRQYKLKDERGIFRSDNYTCSKSAEERPNLYYAIIQPNTGEEIWPSKTRVWSYSKEEHLRHVAEGFIYWGKDGLSKTPSFKRYKHLLRNQGVVPQTLWLHEYASHTDAARKEVRAVLGSSSLEDDFVTPKPEGLLMRVLEVASNHGDLVLDSFLGSGTTAAVAHKMGRRWIGIELGDHCDTHCLPRLKKVVDGADPGGITEVVSWAGGGGFKYYYLAPSILNQDSYGNWVINKKYNPAMLAAAVAKHEGFTFNPDPALYWKQGRSTEKDFIFTTTEFVTQEHVDKIHSEMADDESLLICCKSFNASSTRHPNITIKKIPNMLLGRCEFGKEDYSLNIVNLPLTEDVSEGDATPEPDKGEKKPAKRGRKKKDEQTMPLFDGGDDE